MYLPEPLPITTLGSGEVKSIRTSPDMAALHPRNRAGLAVVGKEMREVGARYAEAQPPDGQLHGDEGKLHGPAPRVLNVPVPHYRV